MSQSHGDTSTPVPSEPKKRKPTETRSRVWNILKKYIALGVNWFRQVANIVESYIWSSLKGMGLHP